MKHKDCYCSDDYTCHYCNGKTAKELYKKAKEYFWNGTSFGLPGEIKRACTTMEQAYQQQDKEYEQHKNIQCDHYMGIIVDRNAEISRLNNEVMRLTKLQKGF